MMRTVLLSLIPVTLMAVYLFGWRVLPLMAVVMLVACVSEYLVMHTIQKEKTKVSEAALVSAALFTLTLPPETPSGLPRWASSSASCLARWSLAALAATSLTRPWWGAVSSTSPSPPDDHAVGAALHRFSGGFASFLPQQTADALSSATPMITFHNTGVGTGWTSCFWA